MTTSANNQKAPNAGSFEFALGDELRGERATLGKSLLDVQRDLRIRAAYVAAIENADTSVFPNPSFVPGYVRSYARYLGLDADMVYERFRAESGFAGPASTARSDRARKAAAAVGPQVVGGFRPDFPMAPRRRGIGLPELPISAIGSVALLLLMVGGLGYGGWAVLENIQRVQFAPVEEIPAALASVATPAAPEAPTLAEPALNALAQPVAAAALFDLYRRQELEVPILVPRDGPIAAIDPERVGLLTPSEAAAAAAPAPNAGPVGTPAGPVPAPVAVAVEVARGEVAALEAVSGAPVAEPAPQPQLTAETTAPALTVVAERAAWIRVYLADGTVLFERILETGETYSPPVEIAGPLIWAGNSGSVFVRLGQVLHGPLGSGTRTVKDVPLDAAAIAARFAVVDGSAEPEAVSRPSDAVVEQAAVTIR